MSERNDRRIPGSSGTIAALLTAVVLITAGGGYLWYRTTKGPQNEPPGRAEGRSPGPVERTNEPFPVTLFLPAEGRLVSAAVAVKRQLDAQLQAREAVVALLAGEQGARFAVLKDLRLRALYLDASGAAYLDLSPVSANQKEIRASAEDELLAVYALVNTLVQNVPEVRQVRFLVDGREVQTLAGHIDLSRSFGKRADLVKTE